MWRRRAGWATTLILSALCTSCVRRYAPGSEPPSLGLRGAGSPPRVESVRRELTATQERVRELEEQLATRDREIAAVRSQIASASGGGGAPPAAELPVPASAPPAQPPDVSAEEPAGAPAAPPEPPRHASIPPAGGALDRAPASAPPPLPSAAAGPEPDPRLAGAQRQVAKLEQQLALEVKRRQEVEAEMTRLLQESSAGPFEQSTGVVEKHLREELEGARREITELRTSLVTERRERQELERRYAALQTQLQAATAAASRAAASEEVEALKERQRRVLASIQQDLEVSRQHEGELRGTLEQAQGPNAVSLADAVTNLRSENSALQMRLDQEHQHNRDLSAKLQLATRVTDLIFKMQSAGAQPAAAVRQE